VVCLAFASIHTTMRDRSRPREMASINHFCHPPMGRQDPLFPGRIGQFNQVGEHQRILHKASRILF
jgi:hypothetical protein